MSSSASGPLPPIYNLSPPHGKITDDDHGGYVVICGWIMMCFFTVSVLTRMLTRFIPVTVGGIDDALSGLSMVFGIAQTASIHISASNGLGQHQRDLSPSSFRTYAKSYYAANILFILAIYCAKASLIFLIIRLSPARDTRRISYGLLGFTTLSGLIFIFLFAFQSALPLPWDYTQGYTISVSALYYLSAAFDILTDLLVTLLPAYVIWHVQIPLRKRVTVIAVFASRVAVIICAAIRISTLHSYLSATDKSWQATTPQTWIQIIQCLSIITACIPCLKPFLESLESGFMDISMTKHTGNTYGGHSGRGGSGRHHQLGYAGNRSRNTNNRSPAAGGGGSFMLNSLASANRDRDDADRDLRKLEPDVEVAPIPAPGAANEVRQGRYLDVSTRTSRHGSAGARDRSGSVPESERGLTVTSKSSDNTEDDVRLHSNVDLDGKPGGFNFGDLGRSHGRAGGGIRVTREVEVRNESVASGEGGYERRIGTGEKRRW